jgi:hypothetical protein
MQVFGMSWEELKKPWHMGKVGGHGFKHNAGEKRGKDGQMGHISYKELKKHGMESRQEREEVLGMEDKKALSKWESMTDEEKAEMKKAKKAEYDKLANSAAIAEFLELDFVAAIEEEMECSGFCKTALFYWEQDIYSGYPQETCAYAVLDFVREAAGPLKAELRVVGACLCFIFVFHFTFYGKPAKET